MSDWFRFITDQFKEGSALRSAPFMGKLEELQNSAAKYITPQKTEKAAKIIVLTTPIFIGMALTNSAHYQYDNYVDFVKKGIALGCYRTKDVIPYKTKSGKYYPIQIYDNSAEKHMRERVGIPPGTIEADFGQGKKLSFWELETDKNILEPPSTPEFQEKLKQERDRIARKIAKEDGISIDEYKEYQNEVKRQAELKRAEHKHKLPPIDEKIFTSQSEIYGEIDRVGYCRKVVEDYNRTHRTPLESITSFILHPAEELSRVIGVQSAIGLVVSALMLILYRAFLRFKATGNPLSNPYKPVIMYASTGVIGFATYYVFGVWVALLVVAIFYSVQKRHLSIKPETNSERKSAKSTEQKPQHDL